MRRLEPLYVGEECGTGPYLSLEGSFGPLRWLYQPCLDKGRSHALIVPRQLPARPRFHQVPKERYLFVLGQLALFVSDELLHQLHEPHLRGWVSPPKRIIAGRGISGQFSAKCLLWL